MQRDLIKILGVNIDNITSDEIGTRVKELIENSNKSCKMVVSPNTEFIMTAWRDKEFFEVLKHADLSTPDSVGVSIGGKLQKKPFRERIPGHDRGTEADHLQSLLHLRQRSRRPERPVSGNGAKPVEELPSLSWRQFS